MRRNSGQAETIQSFCEELPTVFTVEQILAAKMHKARYQCKMNLQICALLSQIGKHQDALLFGHKAVVMCFSLVKNAQMLCKRFVQQIQRVFGGIEEEESVASDVVSQD